MDDDGGLQAKTAAHTPGSVLPEPLDLTELELDAFDASDGEQTASVAASVQNRLWLKVGGLTLVCMVLLGLSTSFSRGVLPFASNRHGPRTLTAFSPLPPMPAQLTETGLPPPRWEFVSPTGPLAPVGSAPAAGPETQLPSDPSPFAGTPSGTGPVRGPEWRNVPLPAVPGGGPAPRFETNPPAAEPAVPVRPLVSEPGPRSPLASELPDPTALAAAAPAAPPRERPKPPPRAPEASPEHPLNIKLRADRLPSGIVVAKMTASTDCNLILVRVNPVGRAEIVFESPAASKNFACVLNPAGNGGVEYLLAVATVYPMKDLFLPGLLGKSGASFPDLAAGVGGLRPAAAWNSVLAFAGTLPAGDRRPAPYEFDVASTSMMLRGSELLTPSTSAAAGGADTKSSGTAQGTTAAGGE